MIVDSLVQVLLTTLIGDMGFYSLIIVYGFFGVCSLITSVIIRKIGHKWSLVIGCFTYVVFLAGNIVVNTPLLLMVSAINGIGGALTWSAHGVRVIPFSIMESGLLTWCCCSRSLFCALIATRSVSTLDWCVE